LRSARWFRGRPERIALDKITESYEREPAPEAFDIASGHIPKGGLAALRVIGFALLAAAILVRRFAAPWRRESARIDRLLEEFNAEIDARRLRERIDETTKAPACRRRSPRRPQREERGFSAHLS
jgi:hypothetical protein